MRGTSLHFIPQHGATGLDPDAARRVTLDGSLEALAWPGLCASCGGGASERLAVTKVFSRDWHLRPLSVNDVKLRVHPTVDVPVCTACAARHRQLVLRIGLIRRIASYLSTVFVIPLAIALFMLFLYFSPESLGSAASLVAVPTMAAQALVIAGFAAVNAWLVVHQTRYRRIPRQTAVTLAFDFSDNLGTWVGRERRVYALTNAAFADAFTNANADRLVR